MSRSMTGPSRGKGFALIEVLTAILIFSFGILSLAGLQAALARAQGSAKFRADAVNLAQDFVALVWTDKPSIAKYDQTACAAHPRCAEWTQKVATILPRGEAETSVAASGAVRVTISWSHNAEGKHTYALETTVGY